MSVSSAPPTIVVLGSINMDVIGIAHRLPSPGETLMGERSFISPGGKGANQAVAAAALGARVRMVGRVGGDMFGERLIDVMRGRGIDVSGVAIDAERSSGLAIIILDARRQNHILAIYGANMACDTEQLGALDSALDGAYALLLQNEIPIPVSMEAAKAARARGVKVIWDPSPATQLPPAAYPLVDIITPNQTEAAYLTGVEVADGPSWQAAAESLIDRGAGAAIIKLGEQGAYYASAGERGHVAAFDVQVVDTVAAGDAFGGALAEGRDLESAVRLRAAAGALAVTRPGAQDSMPSRDDVEALLASA